MIGIYYGSSTGNTEAAANDIAAALGVDAANIHNVGDTDASTVADYDTLLLGSSTWGAGDLQDDWYDFLDNLKAQDLAGKRSVSSAAATPTATATASAAHSLRSTTHFRTAAPPSSVLTSPKTTR